MGKKLLTTIFMLAASVSFAQHERYQRQESNSNYSRPAVQEPQAGNDGYEEIETVENNLKSDDADTSQIDNFKGNNSASNTEGSPQINIYNANSNANKQKAVAKSEGESQVDVSTSNVGGDYASDIKNTRKQMEYRTDEKVIEKLEWSRMEDEKDRADRLFGNRLEKNYGKDYGQSTGYEQPREEYKKPPVIVVEKPDYGKKEETYETSTSIVDSLWQQAYISPMLGVMNSSASQVKSSLSTGVAFGTRFATNFSVEGSFMYSDLTLDGNVNENFDGREYAGFKSADQYSLGAGVSYHLNQFSSIFVPKISGLLAYTYRQFDQTRFGNQSATSTAVDAGIGVGVDMKVSQNVTIGAELRWMSNISANRDNSEIDSLRVNRFGNYGSHNNYGSYNNRGNGSVVSPLEEASYQMFLVNGKFNF